MAVGVGADAGGIPLAALTDRDSLFVEKAVGKGRVIVSAVPLDNTWRTDITSLGDYVRLTHELAYYLASARAGDLNLEARQPIVFRPEGEKPGPVTVQPPEGPPVRVTPAAWPLVYDETRKTGVYTLTTDTGRTRTYVVRPDGNESDLTPLTDADRTAVAELYGPVAYADDYDGLLRDVFREDGDRELWWLLLVGVAALMVGEGVMTRRAAGGT